MNALFSSATQKLSFISAGEYEAGPGYGPVSLYYSQSVHRKSQSTMAGEQTKEAEDSPWWLHRLGEPGNTFMKHCCFYPQERQD